MTTPKEKSLTAFVPPQVPACGYFWPAGMLTRCPRAATHVVFDLTLHANVPCCDVCDDSQIPTPGTGV